MKRNLEIFAAMDRLALAERQFLRADFLAPVVRGRGVAVRISGVRCILNVQPADFEGWGVFRPVSHMIARCVGNASMAQRRRYLDLLPAVRLVVCGIDGRQLLAVPANPSDGRFQLDGAAQVMLADTTELFESVLVRFDGAGFWFDEADALGDPALAAYLRRSLVAMVAPERLEHAGIETGHRVAYAREYRARAEARRADERYRSERRIRTALAQ